MTGSTEHGCESHPTRRRIIGAAATIALGATTSEAQARPSPFDGAQLLTEWARCWTNKDLEGFMALYTDDVVYEDVALGHTSTGTKELREFFQSTLRTFPDFTVTLINVVGNDRFASAEWVMSGTFLGESFGQKPTGKRFRVPGCCFAQLEGRRVRRHCDYWNEPTFGKQVAP